jgi:hypothetical protein
MLTYSVRNSTEFNNNSMTLPILQKLRLPMVLESSLTSVVNSLLNKPREQTNTIYTPPTLVPCQSQPL